LETVVLTSVYLFCIVFFSFVCVLFFLTSFMSDSTTEIVDPRYDVCVCVCMHVRVCVYVYMCVYMYVLCMHVCMYVVCMYIPINVKSKVHPTACHEGTEGE
jgi:hypothetical protein